MISVAKWNEWKEILRLNWRALRDTERYVPGRLPCGGLNAAVDALSPYVTVWLSARIINELAGLRRPEVLIRWVLWTIGTTAVIGVVRSFLKRWLRTLDTLHNPLKNRIFLEKFLDMDYANVDSQHIRDLKAQIEQFQNWQGWGMNMALPLTQNLVQALMGIAGAVALTVSLFTLPVPAGEWAFLNHPLFALGMLAVMALTIWSGTALVNRLNARESAMADEATFGNRLFSAYCGMAADKSRRLDIRTYNQQDISATYLEDSTFGPGGPFDRLAKGPCGILAGVGSGMGAVFTGFVYVFTCLKAWAGAFGVGSITQYVSAVTALSRNISDALVYLDRIRSNHRFLKITYELLDTPSGMRQGSLTVEKLSERQCEVEFRDVSFRYPGSDRWALRHVNMTFKVGKRLAIVGENGSGKTTFIKLLCRLYDPQEGQILLNGVDIRDYRYDDYRNIFSVVFQDFQLICQPLGANVAGAAEYDRQRVLKALLAAGFGDRLASMEKGLDTVIYKNLSEDGVDVSGGEAQKIAIARALYKDAPFVILDEPTAALDPMAEADIYARFDEIAGGKTAIYISHRLSSCKFCDEIAVFCDGSVIQQGTHAGLLAQTEGKYHALWNAQAQYYTAEN